MSEKPKMNQLNPKCGVCGRYHHKGRKIKMRKKGEKNLGKWFKPLFFLSCFLFGLILGYIDGHNTGYLGGKYEVLFDERLAYREVTVRSVCECPNQIKELPCTFPMWNNSGHNWKPFNWTFVNETKRVWVGE